MPPDSSAYASGHSHQPPVESAIDRLDDLVGLAFRTARLGLFERDFRTGEGTWSPAMFEIRGMVSDGRTPSFEEAARNVVDADRPHFDAAMRGSLRPRRGPLRRQTFGLHYRIHAPDGSIRYLHKQWVVRYGGDGHAEHMLGVVSDETSLEAMARSRGAAGAQLDMAAELTGMAFWRQDVQTGEVHLNCHAERLFGIEPHPSPIPLRRLRMGLHHDDRAADVAADASAMEGGKPVDVELRYRSPTGGWRLLMTRRGAQTGAEGRVVSLVGVAFDATDATGLRARAEAALQQSRARNRLLARVSHELRTPMNALLGFAQLLSYQDSLADDIPTARRRAVQHILDAGQHLTALIDDVLDLARLEGGEMTLALLPVSLQDVVASATAMLEAPLRERRMVLSTQDLDVFVLGDATRLRQVVLNLLSNAVKYGRAEGPIHLTAEAEADAVRLRVADDGCGMNADQLAHLFEPFNRLGAERTETQGTGLGLSISKALIERMGGSVNVQSLPGRGTMVELVLLPADRRPGQGLQSASGLA